MCALLFAVLVRVMTTQNAYHVQLTPHTSFFTWDSAFRLAQLAPLNKTTSVSYAAVDVKTAVLKTIHALRVLRTSTLYKGHVWLAVPPHTQLSCLISVLPLSSL